MMIEEDLFGMTSTQPSQGMISSLLAITTHNHYYRACINAQYTSDSSVQLGFFAFYGEVPATTYVKSIDQSHGQPVSINALNVFSHYRPSSLHLVYTYWYINYLST